MGAEARAALLHTLQGEQDPYIDLSQATRLERDTTDTRLVLIPDVGHFLPIDVPQAVAREINAFA